MNKNVIVLVLLVFVGGLFIGYLCKDTKVIDNKVEIDNYKKTIENLQQKLTKAEKTKTTTLYNNGVIASQVVETQIDTHVDTNMQTQIDDKTHTEQKTHTEINPKKYYLEAGYETSRSYYISTNYSLFYNVHIGIGVSSNLTNNTVFRAGLGYSF